MGVANSQPAHSIRDTIEQARCPTTVCISDEGTVMSDSMRESVGEKQQTVGNSAMKFPCEITKSAHFQRALQEESTSRVFRELRRPQHEGTSLKVKVSR